MDRHMLRRVSTVTALATLAALALSGLRPAAVCAQQPPAVDTPSPEEQVRLLEALRDPYYLAQMRVSSASGLTFGKMVPVFEIVHRPVRNGLSVRLEEQVGGPTGALLVQVLRHGAPIWLVEVSRIDGRWAMSEPSLGRARPAACARALVEIGPTDRAFRDFYGGQWFLLAENGGKVRGIEGCSDKPLPAVATMEEYRLYRASLPPHFPGLERAVFALGSLCLAGPVLLLAALIWRRLHRSRTATIRSRA